MISHEIVTGNENGITEVKSVGTILPVGKLHNKSQYLKNGDGLTAMNLFMKKTQKQS